MGKHLLTLRVPTDDGCEYVYDGDTQTIRKICDINALSELPPEINELVKFYKLPVKTKSGAEK
jgi:hypothetical protein